MGVNRARRARNNQRDKFSSARLTNASHEAKTLLDLVKEDVDFACELDDVRPRTFVEVTGATDAMLYEMGILYDSPAPVVVKSIQTTPVEQDADWDLVSEVSEWDVVDLHGSLSDDDSWD